MGAKPLAASGGFERMPRAACLLLATLMLTVSANALAAVAPDVALPGSAQVAEARALAQALLDAPPAEQLRIAAHLAGHEVAPARASHLALVDGLAALAARDGAPLDAGARAALAQRVAALPVGLEAPAAEVVSAVVDAWDLQARAVAGLTREEQAALVALGPAALAPDAGWAVQGPDDAAIAPPILGFPAAERARVAALAARVDVPLLVAAEMRMASAAMDALPALRAVAASLPEAETHCPAAGDLLNMPPYLAIDGNGGCTFHDDWTITIDLGGDDVYNNNAGGATSAARAAVAIDLAGNDRYERALTGSVGNAQIVAQGAGLMGVGLLLDAAGADTYSASIALTPPELAAPPAATLLVQGAAAAGAGALIDLAGPDTFSASASTLGGPAVAAAQGAASLGGVGLLSARGPDTGSRYTATATSGALLTARTATTQTFTIGTSSVYAQGGATTGAGVLVDEAGADIYAARSHSGAAVAYAQGGGVGGAVLVDREGSDTMFAESVADAVLDADWPVTCPPGNTCSFTGALTAEVGMAVIDAHGASDGGFALLADQGAAPNTHEAIARIAPVARSTVHFAGGGGAAGTLTSTVSLNVPTDVRLHADGYANVGGVGMALGGDGSDAWIGRAHVTATAVATSTGGATNAATATATASDAEGNAQGFGALGAGVLNDPGGADTYLVTESTGFSATRNGLPGSGFAGINRFYGRGFAVQGPPPIGTPGAGILVDLGGVDSYSPVYLGTFPGTNERCWSNSAGAPGEVGVGMDVWSNGLGPLPSGCAPPPN